MLTTSCLFPRLTNASRQAVRLLDELPAAVVPELRSYGNRELCGLLTGYATAKHYHKVRSAGGMELGQEAV